MVSDMDWNRCPLPSESAPRLDRILIPKRAPIRDKLNDLLPALHR
jgi:hypothetical protein